MIDTIGSQKTPIWVDVIEIQIYVPYLRRFVFSCGNRRELMNLLTTFSFDNLTVRLIYFSIN